MCCSLNVHSVACVCNSHAPTISGSFVSICMTSYTIFLKLPVFLSQRVHEYRSSSVLSLVVRSLLNEVLYAEAGTYYFISCLGIQTSCYSVVIILRNGPERNGTVPSHYFTERNRLECTYDCQKCWVCVEMR